MIISHRHRFIFVKTAGSSVEVFLSSPCAEEDVVTPLTPAGSTSGVNCWPETFHPAGPRCAIGGPARATGATCRRVLRCADSGNNVGVPISSSPSSGTRGTKRFPTTT
jgi:hypothetical protein